jgi:hypothetical protein
MVLAALQQAWSGRRLRVRGELVFFLSGGVSVLLEFGRVG